MQQIAEMCLQKKNIIYVTIQNRNLCLKEKYFVEK